MTTGAVIVKDAMAKRFILAPNADPDTDQEEFGLRWLNRMLDSWGAQKPMLYSLTEEIFLLSPAVASYSTSLLPLGRPASIDYLFNRNSNVDYACAIVDNQTWADVAYKPVNAIPQICWYNDTMPEGTLNFFPRPFAEFECHVFANRLLTGVVTADTNIVLPPGYEAAIVDNLAVYYPYEVPASADMKRDAKNGMDLLKRANYVPLISDTTFKNSSSINNSFPFPYW